jgi:N-acetylneuraminate synthase
MAAVSDILIGNRPVGESHRPLVIAEVAQAHDGSLGTAHAFIDAIADAGADAVKFQTHIASAESTASEPWRVNFSKQDATRYDYWRRMEFTPERWVGLKKHADERGLIFLSSPFSPEAFELLKSIGIQAWKVASGEVTNLPLLQMILATKLPVLLSSGMSSIADLDQAVGTCRAAKASFGVFQCTTMYPCPPEKIGLNLLGEFRERYGCAVGLSDHSGKIFSCLAAATLGASMIELHVTFSRQMFGPDVPASVTFPELKQLVEGVADIHRMRTTDVKKDTIAAEMSSMKGIFQKTIVARTDLKAGTILKNSDVALKKAGGGIPPEKLSTVIGRKLSRDLKADAALSESDLN